MVLVSGRMWWLLFLVVGAWGCELTPGPGAVAKSPGDNFYKLMVNGEVERYAPGQRYVVTLVGSRTHDVVQQFTRFKLVVEPLDPAVVRSPSRQGQFQLFADTLTQFDEECINTVVEADDLPKTEVQVMWRAPPAGSGCVVLKAMVQEDSGRWFAEDGQLSHRICENVALADPGCCACSSATYTMVFEGLWSAQTHPKNFPTEALWLTHFSDVIGATHPKNFSFWGEGQIASDGFRTLAEWGSVGLLERELRQNGKLLRSIVKAPGLWHPKVNSNTTGKFSVDRKRHLLSLASMFGPSPDWVVGVSGLELCRADCSWEESKVVELRPYDAGTDGGISYMSPNQATIPRERMYRITPMFPEDPRAPFYDPAGTEVPPLARLYLTRSGVVDTSCSEDALQAMVTAPEEEGGQEKPQCAVTPWSAFSACSVSCGKGLRARTRQYVTPDKAAMFNCERQLVSKEMCVASVPECPNSDPQPESPDDLAPVEDNSEFCSTTEWGAWTDCSVTCGIGFRTRRRHFLNQMGLKKCPLVLVEETIKCMQPQCSDSDPPSPPEDPQCPASEWGAWSPCSASCGRGVRFRTRLLLVPAAMQQECASRVELLRQQPCHERDDCSVDMLTAKRICMEPPSQGPCRGMFPRWAFSPQKGMCVPFTFGGCRGNRNNFLTQQECADTCAIVAGGPPPGSAPTVSSNYPGLTFASIVPVPSDNSAAASSVVTADCAVSSWSPWSACSVSCGLGYQQRTRTVLKPAGAGGAPCPTRMSRRRRCSRPCY